MTNPSSQTGVSRRRPDPIVTHRLSHGAPLEARALREGAPARLPLRLKAEIRFVQIAEIEAVKVAGSYSTVFCGERSIRVRRNLKEFEALLAGHRFVRANRSWLVSTDRIDRIRVLKSGDYSLALASGRIVRVGRSYRAELTRSIGLDDLQASRES